MYTSFKISLIISRIETDKIKRELHALSQTLGMDLLQSYKMLENTS